MRNVRTYSMSAVAVVAFVVPVTVSFGGLAGGPAAVETTAPNMSDPRLPEGVYHTPELTRDQQVATAIDAGFAEADVNAFLGTDGTAGTVVFGLRLADGGWSQLYAYDGAAEDVGWRGTYEVVDDDTVIATDPCGAITYDYVFDGDQLTLDMIDDQCDGGVDEMIAQTIIFETSPFTLESPAASEAADETSANYASTSFVVPFEVTLPEWVNPEPGAVLPNFVTWEGAAADRGIRFLVPLNVYLPGATSPTAPPDDYLGYLLGQSEHGATFENVVETTIDGRPATVMTATTSTSLDGSLGCQEEAMFAADCFGLQPDLILRIAVIDTDAGPLLIWVRDIRGADDRELEYESFDAMLASLRFRDDAEPTTDVTTSALATPIDGVWAMTLSRDELANSPLLSDTGELNNQNWGQFTFTFVEGRFVEGQVNGDASWAASGTYLVEGDVLTLDRENGERFVMLWQLEGDTLVLERDGSLGEAPTPFVIKPWTRQS